MKSPDSPERITSEDRLSGAIWGQFVGDAAALGTHWIYDLDDRQKLYPEGVNGFEAPKEGHYHFGKVPGDQTHYGDGALVLLESIAREGKFDARAFGRNFVERFQPGIYGGYFDKATKGTLENFASSLKPNTATSSTFNTVQTTINLRPLPVLPLWLSVI